MKPITTSVYTFSDLIEGGYLYVDKTASIYRLVAEPKGHFFLARPRRFGKSLLVSTLKAIFQGRRELFEGLAISKMKFDWMPHPVIHIDLGSSQSDTPEQLERKLMEAVDEQADAHGMRLSLQGASSRFHELILAISRKGSVVILIDEYDKPLLGSLHDPERARLLLPVLKAFYSVIKTTTPHQRFALLTGVSKFSKVSVFSDLNNLTDLTMDARCATLLGYTQRELESNFAGHIDRLAVRMGSDRCALIEQLRLWYNGYRFEEAAETVYNPVSLMRCLEEMKFKNYWFETGTPSFLPKLLRANDYDLSGIGRDELSEDSFSAYEVDAIEPLPLLFQTGYLTIRSHVRHGVITRYVLDYPNDEVREALGRHLAMEYSQIGNQTATTHLDGIASALEKGDLDCVFASLRVFFANIPHTIQLSHEKYYQTVFHILLTVVGVRLHCEVATESGRIDAVVETKNRIYIFEFKLKGSARTALNQIKEKRYFEKYMSDGREIILVGAAFDKRTRNLGKFIAEPLA